MIVTLYTRKNDGSLAVINSYDMNSDVAKRLKEDWSEHLDSGELATGTYDYKHYQYAGNKGDVTIQGVVLDFKIIAHID